MTLGDILQQAIQRDLAGKDTGSNGLSYTELVKENRFYIKFASSKHPEATIECSVPYTGTQEEENYCRLYFLSQVFNSAVMGRKRIHHTKRK